MLRIKSLILPNQVTVDFSLDKGESLTLTGSNGSGKSLLLKSIARLYECQYQVFEYQNKDIKSIHHPRYRSEVLYVSPSPMVIKDQTVDEFFKSVFDLEVYRGVKPALDYKRILKEWGLEEIRIPHLSSGQRQMISLLRAMTLRANILLLDEPTANLDKDNTLMVEELLREWLAAGERSLLLVSHSDEQARRLAFPVRDFTSLINSSSQNS